MFLLLIAGILIAFSYPGAHPPPGYSSTVTLVGTVLLTLVGAFSGLVLRLGVGTPPALERTRWYGHVNRLIWIGRGLLVGCYVYVIHGFHWSVFVTVTLGLGDAVAVGEVLVLAPFLLAILGSLVLSFPAQRRLSGQAWTLSAYLGFILRQYWAFLLIPWLLFVAVLDLMRTLVTPAVPAAWKAQTDWAVVVGLLVLLYCFWPMALRWLWPTRPLPEGPVRSRLEEICRRAGVGYRDILVWRSPPGGVANAAVAGLAGPLRYILVTDTLLELLEPKELEAVLAHELGHVLKRHIPHYVLFALVFVCLAVLADVLLAGDIPDPYLTASAEGSLLDLLTAAVVVGLYWGLLFGWLSRRFEREADLLAADAVGDPELFARALERIALINGRPTQRPGWRHFSVAERARFLRESARDPEPRSRALVQVRLIRRALLLGTVMALALLALVIWTH